MKYSKKYERDYEFYYSQRNVFNFCGTLTPKYTAVFDENGKSAKEVFYMIDSQGKNLPTNEPELLNELLLCKASINFQIKQWGEGRAKGITSLYELTEEYKNQYNLPEWVIVAVEKQKEKWYENLNIYSYFDNDIKTDSIDKNNCHSKDYRFF